MTSEVGTRLSLSLTDTPTETSTGAGPGPTQTFAFTNVPDMYTCGAATIDWEYSGPDEDFTLLASATRTPHPDEYPIMGAPVGFNIDAASQSFTWASVNLTQGWYIMQATGAGISAESSQFFIANGTDTSCLSPTIPPTTSPSSSSSPPATTSSSRITTTSATTSSVVPVPVSAAVSSHARTGAIAGGVIGGVAIIAAAIAGYIYFGLCRRKPTRSRRGDIDGAGRPRHLGKWGGLSSRDSGMDVGLPVSTAPTAVKPPLVLGYPNKRATTDSTGPILSPLSSTAHGHSTSRRVSYDDVSTIGDEEKLASARGPEFLPIVPPLPVNRRRSSLSSSSATPPFTPIGEPPSARGSVGRTRARSSSQSHRALALAKLDGEASGSPPASVPPTPRTRSPNVPRRSVDSMQLRTFDAAPMPMQVASSPPAESPPINRAQSGGPRRATRKPVPTLDTADLLPPPSATAPSFTSASTATVTRGPSTSSSSGGSRSPAPSPSPMYGNKAGSGSGSTLRPPSTSPVPGRQRSREDLMAAGMELPNLNHKSSFGDKAVHYIIPDMPPPPPSE